ncbi:MAG: hypothetical protein AMXMBFR57_25080 [Acidimicrobiia bacterium]
MQNFFDLQLPRVLQVGARPADFGKHVSMGIGHATHGFGAARINSQDRAHPCQRIALTASDGSGTFEV